MGTRRLALLSSLADETEHDIATALTELVETTQRIKVDETVKLLRRHFAKLGSTIVELQQAARELDLETDTRVGLETSSKHEAERRRLDAEFRKAILIANRNVEKQLRQDRAELMRGGEDALRRRHHEYDPLQTAQEITSSLQRTHSVIKTELERSSVLADLAEQTSRNIKETHTIGSEFSGHIGSAKRAIKKYDLHHRGETILLYIAIIFFVSCCVAIILLRLPTRTLIAIARKLYNKIARK